MPHDAVDHTTQISHVLTKTTTKATAKPKWNCCYNLYGNKN